MRTETFTVTGPAGCCCGTPAGCSLCGHTSPHRHSPPYGPYGPAGLTVHWSATGCLAHYAPPGLSGDEMFPLPGAFPSVVPGAWVYDPTDERRNVLSVGRFIVAVACDGRGLHLTVAVSDYWCDPVYRDDRNPDRPGGPTYSDGLHETMDFAFATTGPVCDADGFVSQTWTAPVPDGGGGGYGSGGGSTFSVTLAVP